MSRRISRAARRYLLTGQPELEAYGLKHSGGRWGVEATPHGPRVQHFQTAAALQNWVIQEPRYRDGVGKRHPLVKPFRRQQAGGGNR